MHYRKIEFLCIDIVKDIKFSFLCGIVLNWNHLCALYVLVPPNPMFNLKVLSRTTAGVRKFVLNHLTINIILNLHTNSM